MKSSYLAFDVHDESHYFYVFVKVGQERVGQLTVDRVSETRARLSDIQVKAGWKRQRSWGERLLIPWRKFESIDLRNLGIGTDLLHRLEGWCERNGIDEVYGSVVESDLKETPPLLEWYEKRGFTIHTPSHECLRHAVKMVVWNRT